MKVKTTIDLIARTITNHETGRVIKFDDEAKDKNPTKIEFTIEQGANSEVSVLF